MFDQPSLVEIDGHKLWLTCAAFPEQYDIYKGDLQVGYLRLRHGSLTVEVPDVGGALVYHASPNGDGSFDDDERDRYLRKAVEAIQAHMATHSA